jgi:HEAT repeat protein
MAEDPTKIQKLIDDFESKDGEERQDARAGLVKIGAPAVESLINALDHHKEQVRWEAAKALVEIADPKAAPALINALEDEDFDVSWVAAEALIALGGSGLPALIEALLHRAESTQLYSGAHHVLKALDADELTAYTRPLIEALEGIDPHDNVPLAAHKIKQHLERS